MKLTTLEDILGVICTRDEAGRHFTQVYAAAALEALEAEGLIEVHRPVHEATGIAYGQECWGVEVTDKGLAVIEEVE